MSTAIQQPPHWTRPVFRPLNTRTDGGALVSVVSDSLMDGSALTTRTQGASYCVLFPNPSAMGRRVTANQNSTGHAMFACPWADAARFETDALGFSNYVSGQRYLSRRIPLRHGDPAQASLFLDSLETISYHNFLKEYNAIADTSDGRYSLGWPKTEMIAYKGTFSQRSYPVFADSEVSSLAVPELSRYITKFPETDHYHRKIPGYNFAFEGAVGENCTVLASLPEYCVRWVYTSYFWPWPSSINDGYIASTLGKVNNAAFDTSKRVTMPNGTVSNGFPAECLKFEDHRLSQPYYGSDDKLYVDQQFVLSFNPRNWNKQLRPSSGEYEKIKQKSGASTFYDPPRYAYIEADFNKLFKPMGAT